MQALRGKDDEIAGLLQTAEDLAVELKDTVVQASEALREAVGSAAAEGGDDGT